MRKREETLKPEPGILVQYALAQGSPANDEASQPEHSESTDSPQEQEV
jgi:hypothetical protein